LLTTNNVELEETYGYGMDVTLSINMGLDFQPNQS
jgi:hypothetical protein